MLPVRLDRERAIDLDLVRCTENAALAAWKYFGKGDKNQADAAASDAMRGMFSLVDCRGLVRIGEGRKDDAPGIFTDERLGSWRDGAVPVAIAVDPIDGTTLTAKGLPGAISVLAVSTCSDPEDDPRLCFRPYPPITWRNWPSDPWWPKATSAFNSTRRWKPISALLPASCANEFAI